MNSILAQQTQQIAVMNDSADVHLTDDQIDDHLMGDLAAEPALHLASCNACTERVAAAFAPIASFDQATLAWGERHSATLPLPEITEAKPVWQRHMSWVTTTFALAIGLAVVNLGHQMDFSNSGAASAPRYSAELPAAAPAISANAVLASAPAPAQLSADNQMLSAINVELDASTETPAQLGLERVNAHPARALATIAVQD